MLIFGIPSVVLHMTASAFAAVLLLIAGMNPMRIGVLILLVNGGLFMWAYLNLLTSILG